MPRLKRDIKRMELTLTSSFNCSYFCLSDSHLLCKSSDIFFTASGFCCDNVSSCLCASYSNRAYKFNTNLVKKEKQAADFKTRVVVRYFKYFLFSIFRLQCFVVQSSKEIIQRF